MGVIRDLTGQSDVSEEKVTYRHRLASEFIVAIFSCMADSRMQGAIELQAMSNMALLLVNLMQRL